MNVADPTMARLEDQISWYDKRSTTQQRLFKSLKRLEILAAALIPFAAGSHVTPWVTGGLGVLVVFLEGLQHLGQYDHNWISYRSTCEALKHEKFLYLAAAGPYAAAANPHMLLAERIEGLISQEHAKWVSSAEEFAKGSGRTRTGN